MKIYVGNLSHNVSEEDLRLEFETFGTTTSVTIVKDKYTGNPRGFGFVEMSSQKEAQAAIEGLNGKDLKGRNISVNEARPKTENRGYGGNRGGGKGGQRGSGGGYGRRY